MAVANGVHLEAFDGFDPKAFLPQASEAEAAASLDALVAFNRRSAKTHSGIWRDLAVRKRKTEVEAQLGPVAEAGRAKRIATPLTSRLIELIHDIEDGRRPLDWATLDELWPRSSRPRVGCMKIAFDGKRAIVTGAGARLRARDRQGIRRGRRQSLGLRCEWRRLEGDARGLRRQLRGADPRRK